MLINNWKVLVNIAESCYNRKDYLNAIEYAKQAIEVEMFSIDAYYLAGMSYYHLKNYSSAIDDLQAYLSFVKHNETNRKRFITTYVLAQCYYYCDNLDQAKDYLIDCIKRYKFPSDDENTLLQNTAQQLLVNIDFKIEEIRSLKSNFILDYGLNEILSDVDDPIFWNRILLQYLPEAKDFQNDLSFKSATLKFGLLSVIKNESEIEYTPIEEWYLEQVSPSKFKPKKNLANPIRHQLISLGISRPSKNVDVAVARHSVHFDGKISSSISSHWHRDKNGIWREDENSIDQLYIS